MGKKCFDATIVGNEEIAKDTYEVVFELNCENFSFTPGQYVWIVLPKLKYPDERGNRRSFSIVFKSGDKSNQIRSVFRKSNTGFKKTLINMPIGSTVRIDGPFGFCVLPKDETTPVIFLVGGVGISSVFTMISHAITNKSSRKIMLIYANKNSERAAYINELENFQRENKNFTLIQHSGELNQETIFSNTKDLANPIWYIFGPEPMVFGVGEILEKNDILSDRIETEEFRLCVSAVYKENLEILNSDTSLKTALDNAFNHIILTDSEGKIRYANHGAEVITGYSVKEMISNTSRLWGGLMDEDFYKSLWKTIKKDKKTFLGEIKNRKKNGDTYIARIQISPFLNPKNQNLIGFVGTEEDITKEKEIEKNKTDFLNLASHQLRTPLTGIQWTAEIFAKKEKLTNEGKKYLQNITFSARRLNDLVLLLLNTSRIEGGRIVVSLKPVEAVIFINEFLKKYVDLCEKKQLICSFSEHPMKLDIVTDPNLLEEIIQNIVGNSIDYTPTGGEIELSLKNKKDTFLLTIHNTGPAIPKKDQGRIFEKFFRASSAVSIKPDGTGLGLYIVSEAVKLLGGKIWFESEEGKGTTFYVELPLESKAKVGEKTMVDSTS